MKRTAFILLVALVIPWQAHSQQKTNDPLADAMKLLQKAMQDYQKDPHAASVARSNIAASAKAAAAAAKADAAAAPPSVPLVAPPPARASDPATIAATSSARSFAEMEQAYLEGKISAKDFQKYLQGLRIKPIRIAEAPVVATNLPATVNGTNAPVLPKAEAVPGTMTDVEKRLDELIRAQEAREKAATNQVAAPTGAKTKRQKLDDLLKQLVEGKVTDEDYKARREKILAEPD